MIGETEWHLPRQLVCIVGPAESYRKRVPTHPPIMSQPFSIPLRTISFQELNFLSVAWKGTPEMFGSLIFEHTLLARPDGFGKRSRLHGPTDFI